ncbi:bifunctional diaminohydroxyphosphoribosylaminopyrimidine deaminase/5-amino-6-(5-phosphoribosylamino)uracil reductase, partial [bacterium]|nr:bifunctional diaminohydroxyphosphoribosylaminopyrimidine deaminase/5-amino-6-(5-phosphoribosylamino)uracil reductase [bacterium]
MQRLVGMSLGGCKAARPNPAVSAILTQGDRVVGAGVHEGPGKPHAEVLAIQAAGEEARGGTLYVSLEPCTHWGRTPPCVDGLIERRVHTVVFAYRDPNPLVADNNTTKRLQAHGIQVVYYPVPEIDAFYESYAYWLRTGLPWVTVKMA